MENNPRYSEFSEILLEVPDFGIEMNKVSKIEKIDTFQTLTERPPMITIGQDVWHIEYEDKDGEKKSVFVGTLFNPGHTPKTTTIGLAVSQVIATATLNHDGEMAHKKGRTPMVTSIGGIRFTEEADTKTPSKEPFYIVIPEGIEGGMQTKSAGLYYQKRKLCDVSLQMQGLAPQILSKRGERKRIDWGEKGEERDAKQTAIIETLTQGWDEKKVGVYVPGFGDDYKLEASTEVSETQRDGVMRVQENVFQGHFPDAPIVPLAGTALPGFMMALKWFNETHPSELFEISAIEGVAVHEAVLPNDILYYQLQRRNERSFSLEVFFVDKDEQTQKAITFENVEIGQAKRLENLWNDEAIADAFAFQNHIPEYQTEQLDVFREQVRKACLSVREGKTDVLKIADIGVGVAGNISQIVLEELGEAWQKSVLLSLSDVDTSITKKSEENLRQRNDLAGRSVEIRHFESSATGEVIPDIGEQDILVANFSMNYGHIEQTLKKLSESVRIGGSIVLGLVNPHPKYYKLMNMVAQRMNEAQDWSLYEEYLKMKEAGNAMDYFDILGAGNDCAYIEADTMRAKLETSGFTIDEVIKDTFCGIGFIIRGRKNDNI